MSFLSAIAFHFCSDVPALFAALSAAGEDSQHSTAGKLQKDYRLAVDAISLRAPQTYAPAWSLWL
jgi:hypothetical protein